jgi:hypothetical protein
MYDRVGGETAAIKNSWSEADKPSPKKYNIIILTKTYNIIIINYKNCMRNESIIWDVLFGSGAITCYLPWQNM